MGLFLIGLSLSYQFDEGDFTEPLIQIVNDWTAVPFVNLHATSEETCPGDSELVFYKPWYGTQTECFCHRDYMSDHHRGACSDSKTRVNFDFDSYSCMELEAIAPVLQGSFNGVRVCGDRGGSSFYKVIRVDESGNCPEGT